MTRFLLFSIFTFSFLVSNAYSDVVALLLALEHPQQNKTTFIKEDIKELSEVLEIRVRGNTNTIYDLKSSSSGQNPVSYRNAVIRKIKDWKFALCSSDTALLYISGHCIKNKEGKVYWQMSNFDEKHWQETTIPISEIREQLSACSAQNKLLFLDTSNSGTVKTDSRQVSAAVLAREFADVPHLVTIVSCKEDQESLLGNQVQHSLFAFWLIQAFKGAADVNEDENITFEELKNFLSNNVSMAAGLQNQKQNPVFVNEKVLDNTFRFEMRSLELESLYKNIAEQLDAQMRIRNLYCLAIPDFTSGKSFDENNGENAILLKDGPRKVIEYLKSIKRRNGQNVHYKILSQNQTLKMIKDGEIVKSESKNGETWTLRTSSKAGKTPFKADALFCGNIQGFSDAGLQFTGKLAMAQKEGETVCHSVGLMANGIGSGKRDKGYPDYEALGMAGRSMIPPPYNESRLIKDYPDENTPHPLSVEKYRKEIADIKILARPAGSGPEVEYVERKLSFNGNRCDVVLKKGEEYVIRIDNNTGKKIFPRVLVDGLNSLDQYVLDCSNADNESEKRIFAPRVALPEARCWILDPDRRLTVKGFYITGEVQEIDKELLKEITKEGKVKVRRFTVVDAKDSLSAKNGNRTEHIGIITVGIYDAIPRKEAEQRRLTKGTEILGTDGGKAETINMEVCQDDDAAGFPLMIVNIHY